MLALTQLARRSFDFSSDINWPIFNFYVDLANISAKNTQSKQL
jgi:hypothetical protein